MTQPFRLRDRGRVDRAQPMRFTFDGRDLEGYEGDTLASALLANGIHLVGRSFKYHRPRGILSAGPEEPNALVQLGTGAASTPNARATEVVLTDGLVAASQNCWPSVGFDLGGAADLVSGLLPAGFYYKTFMGAQSWMLYEHFIRRAAGLGRAPDAREGGARDPDRYDHTYAHCDVLVVGGGPAGLAAALAASRAGARVLFADDQRAPGGRLRQEANPDIDGKPALDWVAAAWRELATHDVVMPKRLRVVGYYDGNFLTAVETPPTGPLRERLWKIRARQVVLATGAIERPLVFVGNDRPGVMLAGAVRAYLNRYGVLAGRRAVLFATNDGAYRTALDLHGVGAGVVVVDRRRAPDGALIALARQQGIEVIGDAAITATRGHRRVTSVTVQGAGGTRRLDCDLVAMSGGWMPSVHLFSQSRGKLAFDQRLASYVPGESPQPVRSAGACNGALSLEACLAQGLAAGAAAARDAGFGDGTPPPTPRAPEPAEAAPGTDWIVPGDGKRFVDFQNDVTVADLELAAREGYGAVEHAKRYTTQGMGTDQGKTSSLAALSILSQASGTPIPAVGHTTFRPPWTPVTFGAIAGAIAGPLFAAARVTPIQSWHVANDAVFEDVGAWKRPRYFPHGRETMAQAVARECRAARGGAAMLDASTLGKIDVQGPDAATFLNRIYVNNMARLGVASCRYGLMLNENGMIFDDGVATRLADDHFHVTTTTGGAAHVLDWFEEWLQTEWTDLAVFCTEVTEQWAVISLSGRGSRAMLAPLTDIDLADAVFPAMTMRTGTIGGVPARVFRIGFTGALSYEINVPARFGLALWQALHDAGAVPYGTEAMHVLRAEMGFIIVGQETDGTVIPDDVGLGRMVARAKGDFVGRRSLARRDTARPGRKQLVGLLTEQATTVLVEGAPVTAQPVRRPPAAMLGHVTSSYWSPTLGRSIALALVENGRARIGETLIVPSIDGRNARVRVTEPSFVGKAAADG